jgi:hypothetical protein
MSGNFDCLIKNIHVAGLEKRWPLSLHLHTQTPPQARQALQLQQQHQILQQESSSKTMGYKGMGAQGTKVGLKRDSARWYACTYSTCEKRWGDLCSLHRADRLGVSS